MRQKTEPRAGGNPARGEVCNSLNRCICSNCSGYHDQKQELAGLIEASIVPALRSYMKSYEDLLMSKANGPDFLPGLVLEFSKALLAEAERRQAAKGGDHE